MSCWVICSGRDLYTSKVIEELARRSVLCEVIDHDKNQPISIFIDQKNLLRVSVSGCVFSSPKVIWRRSKIRPEVPNEFRETHGELPRVVLNLRVSEWRAAVDAISASYLNLSVQPEVNLLRQNSKPYQLKIAHNVGFSVAEFVISTSKDAIINFVDRVGKCVIKAMGSPVLSDDTALRGVLVTTAVDREVFLKLPPEAFSFVPMMVQKRLVFGRELRVIAIDDSIFPYEIEGNIEDRLHPDVRLLKPVYHRTNNSLIVEQLCRNYLKAAGLRYGVFDLIAVPGQETPYFLECNPEGQWQSALEHNLDEVVERFCDLVERVACGELASA